MTVKDVKAILGAEIICGENIWRKKFILPAVRI
jgi:hypothetical protein